MIGNDMVNGAVFHGKAIKTTDGLIDVMYETGSCCSTITTLMKRGGSNGVEALEHPTLKSIYDPLIGREFESKFTKLNVNKE